MTHYTSPHAAGWRDPQACDKRIWPGAFFGNADDRLSAVLVLRDSALEVADDLDSEGDSERADVWRGFAIDMFKTLDAEDEVEAPDGLVWLVMPSAS